MTPLFTPLSRWFLPLLAITTLHADPISNADVPAAMDAGGGDYLLDDFARDWGANAVYIGNTTGLNTLTIQNGATATNGGTSSRNYQYIGYASTANQNAVTVTGEGSEWSAATRLYVGYLGSNNSLTVSAGGKVSFTTSASVGAGSTSDSSAGNSNTLSVTGAGSLFTTVSGDFSIGSNGSDNSLSISDGGRVEVGRIFLGNGNSSNAALGASNEITITGGGSLKTNGFVAVGYNGSGNQVSVTDGTVETGGLLVGNGTNFNALAGSQNEVLISGANTHWTNTYQFFVGVNGSENSLNVAAGARLDSEGEAIIGQGYYDNMALGGSNTVTVTGINSRWSNDGILVVGDYGSGNTLTVADGGLVESGATTIGRSAGASENSLIVTGAGSIWATTGDLSLAVAGGSGNTLTLLDGGLARLGDGTHSDIQLTINTGVVQLDGGFLAIYGDRTALIASLLADDSIQVRDGDGWRSATLSDVSFQYFSDSSEGIAAASSFTSGLYGDLGGYTIVTTAVPEPATWVLSSLGLGAIILLRRRVRNSRTESCA